MKCATIEQILGTATLRRIVAEVVWRERPSPETEARLAGAAAVERSVRADAEAVKVYR